MTEEKIKQISEAVSGMTRAEWSRVVIAIEKIQCGKRQDHPDGFRTD